MIMRGFTLIESVVVIAILSTLALVSMNTITEFQRNAILSSATQELGSTLRLAEADSSSGLVKTGETYADTGYPYYGVTLTYDSGNKQYIYQLTRTYTLTGLCPDGNPGPCTETLEQHTIDSSITASPSPLNVTFVRVTGAPSSTPPIILTRTGTTTSRTISINGNGLISL